MKVYISCDIEGLAGIVNFDMERQDTAIFRELYNEQIGWIIEGIQKSQRNAEITEITISDSHAKGCNLSYQYLTGLDDRISLINGYPREDYMMSGLDSSYDVVIFAGYHAGIGELHGNMDHGYSARVAYNLWINDRYMNETTINAAYASSLGVPVGLIIGESGLEKQLKEMMPWVPFVKTKESLGRYAAKSLPKKQIREEIYQKVAQVLDNDTNPQMYQLAAPYTVRIQCASTAQADKMEMLPDVKRLDGRMIEYTFKDMKTLLNGLVGMVNLGGTEY